MLDAPQSDFEADLAAIVRGVEVRDAVRAVRRRTHTADRDDLREALGDVAVDDERVMGFLATRADPTQPLPDGLPEEFRRYAEAVRSLHGPEVDLDGARVHLDALLALPVQQRRWRSTWATYTLARVSEEQEADSTDVLDELAHTRTLAEAGLVDSIGLAAASWRRAATVRVKRGEPGLAIDHCLRYRAAGGTRFCQKLDRLARRALEGDLDALKTVVRDSPPTADVLAAWLTHGPHTDWTRRDDVPTEQLHRWHVERFLTAAEAAGTPMQGADRLAWAAYQAGAFEQAEHWVARTSPSDPIGRWMAAKLALRRGELDPAIEAYEAAVALLPSPTDTLFSDLPAHTRCKHHRHNPVRALYTELGVAQVAAGHYEDALKAFLVAGNWSDAAWVSERLLTTSELRTFVARWFPVHPLPRWPVAGGGLSGSIDLPSSEVPYAMRALLARRLAREGQWDEAVAHFPDWGVRSKARNVASDLAIGRDETRADAERAEALWRAARTWKEEGWSLVATELEPDFRVLHGGYEGADTTARRLEGVPKDIDPESVLARRALAPGPQEQARIAAHAPPVDRRYHFIYTAQEVAWQAVQLMPDGHPALVDAACVAGAWTRVEDPPAADRFWKALYQKGAPGNVRSRLLARGWFPPLEDGRCAPPEPRVEPTPAKTCGTAPYRGRGLGGLGGLGILAGLIAAWRRRQLLQHDGDGP